MYSNNIEATADRCINKTHCDMQLKFCTYSLVVTQNQRLCFFKRVTQHY